MFSLLKAIIKYTFYLMVFVLLLLTILPYMFSLTNPVLTTATLPFTNSKFETQGEHFVHYRLFVPEKIQYKVLMLPGFAGSTFSFHKTYDSLVEHNCLVVAVDLPPFGFSVKNNAINYSDTIIIDLLEHIIVTADSISQGGKWIIAGHSLGVYYAAKMISRFPDLFSKQIFIDGYYTGIPSGAFTHIALYPPFMRLADVVIEKNYLSEKKFSELIQSAYGRKPSSDEINGYKQPFKFAGSGSAVLKWATAEHKIKINTGTIYRKPTLVIWGKTDTWLPYNEIDFKLEAFKDVSFKMIDSAGHVPMETHSDLVNKYLLTFIND